MTASSVVSEGLLEPAEQPTYGSGQRLRASEPVYLDLLGFLWDEASTLDKNDLAGWLDFLDPHILYTMPVRVTRRRDTGSEFHAAMMHLDEEYSSLKFRVKRFLETQAWSEDPPSRTRRFVTGVRVYKTDTDGDYDVSSSLLLTRTQDDDYRVDIVTAEREDRIRLGDNHAPRLVRRQILIDQSTVGTPNLAIFL
jgi:3-phenylpropionate/cinnamic acid dioxygenase small subunit